MLPSSHIGGGSYRSLIPVGLGPYSQALLPPASEKLVSLAHSLGQEAPWQHQGQGAALTREVLGLHRDTSQTEPVLSKAQSKPTVLLIRLVLLLPACFLSLRDIVALRGRLRRREGQKPSIASQACRIETGPGSTPPSSCGLKMPQPAVLSSHRGAEEVRSPVCQLQIALRPA